MEIRTIGCHDRVSWLLGNPDSALCFVRRFTKLETLTMFHDEKQCRKTKNNYHCRMYWMNQIEGFARKSFIHIRSLMLYACNNLGKLPEGTPDTFKRSSEDKTIIIAKLSQGNVEKLKCT